MNCLYFNFCFSWNQNKSLQLLGVAQLISNTEILYCRKEKSSHHVISTPF